LQKNKRAEIAILGASDERVFRRRIGRGYPAPAVPKKLRIKTKKFSAMSAQKKRSENPSDLPEIF